MSTFARQIDELIKHHKLTLVRSKKHAVYRHPDGRIIVFSKSPSDSHAENMRLRHLRKFLGVKQSKQQTNQKEQ